MPAQPAAQLSSPSCSSSVVADSKDNRHSVDAGQGTTTETGSGGPATGSRKNSADSASGSAGKPPKPAPPPRAPNTNRTSGHRLHSGRTIEKQQTIDEKSSPPMWAKDIRDKGT